MKKVFFVLLRGLFGFGASVLFGLLIPHMLTPIGSPMVGLMGGGVIAMEKKTTRTLLVLLSGFLIGTAWADLSPIFEMNATLLLVSLGSTATAVLVGHAMIARESATDRVHRDFQKKRGIKKKLKEFCWAMVCAQIIPPIFFFGLIMTGTFLTLSVPLWLRLLCPVVHLGFSMLGAIALLRIPKGVSFEFTGFMEAPGGSKRPPR